MHQRVAAGLVEGDEILERLSDQVASAGADLETVTETEMPDGRIERSFGIGVQFESFSIIGRAAREDIRRRLVRRLVRSISDEREPEINWASAAGAVFNLASGIPDDVVPEVLAVLRPLAYGSYKMSEIDQESIASQHPFSRFQFGYAAPDHLRATALEAWGRIIAVRQATDEALEQAIVAAFESGSPRVVAGALGALTRLETLECPVPLESLMAHQDGTVRLAALRAWVARDGTISELAILPTLLEDHEVSVRLALITLAKEPNDRAVLAALAEDSDAYVRVMAQASLARAS